MLRHLSAALSLLILVVFAQNSLLATENAPCPQTLDFNVKTLGDDKVINLCKHYYGQVVMIVNTASKCGYTPQYEGLEALYRKYRDQGFVILGFPSNDFGGQEPGTEKQIKEFCRLTYGVEFPMFEKTHAIEQKADPVYRTLGSLAGEYPQWNFHKYIVDRSGKLVGSFNSKVTPESRKIISTIEKLL